LKEANESLRTADRRKDEFLATLAHDPALAPEPNRAQCASFTFLAIRTAGSRTMRLPRWLVVTLLTASLFAVLGSGAWWWMTWPGRVALQFVALLANGDREVAIGMIHDHDSPAPSVLEATLELRSPAQRTLKDIIAAKQGFRLDTEIQLTLKDMIDAKLSFGAARSRRFLYPEPWCFSVERGKVIHNFTYNWL
jgi:hypothetical protein